MKTKAYNSNSECMGIFSIINHELSFGIRNITFWNIVKVIDFL